MSNPSIELELRQKLLSETAKISWLELQPFFAKGQIIYIDPSLDLIDVAFDMASDNAQAIQHWMTHAQVGPLSATQAQDWFTRQPELWACVVAPWILVQERRIN